MTAGIHIDMALCARELKARAEIGALAAKLTKLRPNGKQLVGLCPLHRERHPSFYVHPEKQGFKCFGCGAGGDVFDLVMLATGCDFRRALEVVAEFVGGSGRERAAKRPAVSSPRQFVSSVKVSGKTAKNLFATMQMLWKSARAWGYVAHDAVSDVVLPKRQRVTRRFFSIEEVQRILASAPEPYNTFYWLAVDGDARGGIVRASRE